MYLFSDADVLDYESKWKKINTIIQIKININTIIKILSFDTQITNLGQKLNILVKLMYRSPAQTQMHTFTQRCSHSLNIFFLVVLMICSL